MLTTTIYRTYNPKLPGYASDGTGRDKYITYGNGGFVFQPPFYKTQSSVMLQPVNGSVNIV